MAFTGIFARISTQLCQSYDYRFGMMHSRLHTRIVAAIPSMKPYKWQIYCRAPYRQNPTRPYMTKLTIGRMANLYGLHRSTLHEAVAKGRVTAGLDGKGQKVIDLSEMIRVYGEPSGPARHSPTLIPDTPPALSIDALQPLLDELRFLREEIRELRNNLRLIEHKSELKPESKEIPEKAKGPVTWGNLLSALDD